MPIEGTHNFRDIGGYATANGRHVRWGMIYRSGASALLTPTASLGFLGFGNQVTYDPRVLIANGTLIRDARLDRYLAAHKQFTGSSALGVPSAFLRSATADAWQQALQVLA